jgi:hypothetical protein
MILFAGYFPDMPAMHHPTQVSFFLLWLLAVVCCGIGTVFLYKAFAPRGLRPRNVRESRALVSPIWVGRIISVLLGLTGFALGLEIIVRMLKHLRHG